MLPQQDPAYNIYTSTPNLTYDFVMTIKYE